MKKFLFLLIFLIGVPNASAEIDKKGWLKLPGSTSEWLESKNWNNKNWWINNLASFYDSPKSKISQKIIDEARIKTCNHYIELYDFPKGLKKSCINIYKKLPERIIKGFSREQKAFYEGKSWEELRYTSNFYSDKSFLESYIENRGMERGWFNKDYWKYFAKKEDLALSEKNWVALRQRMSCNYDTKYHTSQLNEKPSKNELKNKFDFPTLGIYVDCLEARKSPKFNSMWGFKELKSLKVDNVNSIKKFNFQNNKKNLRNDFVIDQKFLEKRLETACRNEIFFDDCVIESKEICSSEWGSDYYYECFWNLRLGKSMDYKADKLLEYNKNQLDAQKYCDQKGLKPKRNRLFDEEIKNCYQSFEQNRQKEKTAKEFAKLRKEANEKVKKINKNEDLVLFHETCYLDFKNEEKCMKYFYLKDTFNITNDGVTIFEYRVFNTGSSKEITYDFPRYERKSIMGIDCKNKEAVSSNGRRNLLFRKDATEAQKYMYNLKMNEDKYEVACNNTSHKKIKKSSIEIFGKPQDSDPLWDSIKKGQEQQTNPLNKEEPKVDNQIHEKCIKASDYKGCMNYQSRTQ